MSCLKIYGKNHALSKLRDFSRSGRIPHGIFFIGAPGLGKKTLAFYTATAYLCQNRSLSDIFEPCGQCLSCRKAEAGVHPDIIFARAFMNNEKYKIEHLRGLISAGNVRPNDGELKVYIFGDCENMSEACQNALLKFIEEPLEFNRFIFTASDISGILPTVLSRLIRIDVEETSRQETVSALYELFNIDEEQAEKAYALYGGNIGRCAAACKTKTSDLDLNLLTAEIIDALILKNEYLVAAAFAKLKDRNAISSVLPLLRGVFRDGIVYNRGGDNLTSVYREGAKTLSQLFGLERLVINAEKIDKFIVMAEQNPNVTLAVANYASEIFNI